MEAPRKLGYKTIDVPSCIIASPCFLWAVVASADYFTEPESLIVYDSKGSADNKVLEFILFYWQWCMFTPAVPIPMINGIYVYVPKFSIANIYFEPMQKETKIVKYQWTDGDELK
jgi:hypothetical protein